MIATQTMIASQTRLGSLDALRGLAALGVVLFHYLPYYNELFGHSFRLPQLLTDTLLFGRYGVHLFFILSGFVIFMTLERTRNAAWFGLARGARLLPALWTGIVLTFVSVHLLGPESRAVSLETALLNATLLHEYLGAEHVDGAYWSLVIEATFYSWMALFFYSLRDWTKLRLVFRVWMLISYAGVIWWKQIPESMEFLIKDLMFVKYAPLFIGGILIYRIYRYGRPATGDAILLALAVCHGLLAYKMPYSLFVLGCFTVFALAVAGRLNWLANRPMLWLGSLSYSLYLVHQNIGYGVITWSYQAGLPGWLGVCLALATALLLASAIHYSIEKPALRQFRAWRSRAETTQTQAATARAID
ncbi:acyltransferase [Streptosporangium jomthongense]|uniref:Acyltransferase family protein n=1 Tax=Marinobacter aromaticivorans TaxID=1494078 RepID=A0ABW2IPW5_9GAMM|nr:acyltransferase [Marinobacter aromaticivorans]GGE52693.1 acyltransferase [Streptosporangium jomthongense]